MSELTLTPLGTSPAWYNPGEPTTGYLLEVDGFRLLLDCGSGVVARYLQVFGPSAPPIDAIVISHCHADHVFDLVPLKYGLEYGPLKDWETRPQLWLPPGGHARLRTLVSAWDGPADFFSSVYDVRDYAPAAGFEVGPFEVASFEVPHYIESFALRMQADGASFGYSSDLGPTNGLAEFLRGVDLLLCEATLADPSDEPADARGHLAASEAGELARAAGARSLLLTHVPVEVDPDASLDKARAAFGGPAALASSSESYVISHHLAARAAS
jgi:ribonuclease BN (tRNA processing enzyme)